MLFRFNIVYFPFSGELEGIKVKKTDGPGLLPGIICPLCGAHTIKSYSVWNRDNAPDKIKHLFQDGVKVIRSCRKCVPYTKEDRDEKSSDAKGKAMVKGKSTAKVSKDKLKVSQGNLKKFAALLKKSVDVKQGNKGNKQNVEQKSKVKLSKEEIVTTQSKQKVEVKDNTKKGNEICTARSISNATEKSLAAKSDNKISFLKEGREQIVPVSKAQSTPSKEKPSKGQNSPAKGKTSNLNSRASFMNNSSAQDKVPVLSSSPESVISSPANISRVSGSCSSEASVTYWSSPDSALGHHADWQVSDERQMEQQNTYSLLGSILDKKDLTGLECFEQIPPEELTAFETDSCSVQIKNLRGGRVRCVKIPTSPGKAKIESDDIVSDGFISKYGTDIPVVGCINDVNGKMSLSKGTSSEAVKGMESSSLTRKRTFDELVNGDLKGDLFPGSGVKKSGLENATEEDETSSQSSQDSGIFNPVSGNLAIDDTAKGGRT